MENKRVWKLVLAFVAIFFVVFLGWFAMGFWGQDAREAREAEEYSKNLEEQYKNDPYGGETPEETIALFIDALEKGDIELASKYFIPEEREEIENKLTKTKNNDGLINVIARMKKLALSSKTEETAFFVLESNGVVNIQVTLARTQSNRWKIIDM